VTPEVWTVLYKPHKKYARWRVLGSGLSYTAAVALIVAGTGKAGDFWLTDRHEPEGTNGDADD